jgi:hypothetical protein
MVRLAKDKVLKKLKDLKQNFKDSLYFEIELQKGSSKMYPQRDGRIAKIQ